MLYTMLLLGSLLAAQSNPIPRVGDFVEGLYFSHAALLNGTPDLRWEEIEGEMVQLPEDFRLQIAGLKLKNGAPLPKIYALSLDGFPYLFGSKNEKLNYHEFAGLRLEGRYRYYEFKTTERTNNMMYAYNPLNGRPFRQARVERDRPVMKRFVLDLATGKQQPFSPEGVARVVETDKDLLRAVNQLAPDDADLHQKLMQALRLYNERYPFKFTPLSN